MESKIEKRLRNFQKPNLTGTEFKRQKYAVQLRKKKRTEAQNHFRYNKASLDTTIEMDIGPTESGEENESFLFSIPELIESLDELKNLDLINLEISLNYLKNILSSKDAPIKDFVLAGLIPKILPFTSSIYNTKIRYLAFWIFCNISSTNDTYCEEQILKYNIINLFLEAICEKNEEINENPLWGLSNLLADSEKFCSNILSKNFLSKVLELLNRTQNSRIYSLVAWCMNNVCHFESLLDLQMTELVLKICEKILEHPIPKTKKRILHIIGVLIRSDNEKVEVFLNSPIFQSSFTYWSNPLYYFELVKISANICSGDHRQTQKMLDLGILDLMYMLIDNEDEGIAYTTYWLLSNVAAGRPKQLIFLESHVVFYKALNGLLSLNEKIKVEVSFIIRNFMKQASDELKKKLITDKFMEGIIEALKFINPEFIINLLTVFEGYISIRGKFEFLDKQYNCIIESLQKHRNEDVYTMCEKILESVANY